MPCLDLTKQLESLPITPRDSRFNAKKSPLLLNYCKAKYQTEKFSLTTFTSAMLILTTNSFKSFLKDNLKVSTMLSKNSRKHSSETSFTTSFWGWIKLSSESVSEEFPSHTAKFHWKTLGKSWTFHLKMLNSWLPKLWETALCTVRLTTKTKSSELKDKRMCTSPTNLKLPWTRELNIVCHYTTKLKRLSLIQTWKWRLRRPRIWNLMPASSFNCLISTMICDWFHQ